LSKGCDFMFVDTHCHIGKENVSEYVSNATNAQVGIILNASEDLKTSIENVKISQEYSNVYACVGVHPENVLEYDFDSISEFRELVKNKCVKAIGEIGLDYYHSKENKELQIKVFREFLALAEECGLPVVIHSREATQDTINILKEYNVKGVIHCFSGSLETAKEYMKMGFSLGVGGVLTFKNSKLNLIIKEVPMEYIVLETDSPFLTPEPYRKYKNESKYIPVIGEYLANLKGITLDEVKDITTDNARRIFDI